MCAKDAHGVANSVDPDQTAPKEQSDLGLHCLLRPNCFNTFTTTASEQGLMYTPDQCHRLSKTKV